MSNFWDDPDLERAAKGGDYIKFETVGDTAFGTIAKLDKKVFPATDQAKERTTIEVTFDDGRIMTVGQFKLVATFFQLQPQVGDQIEVTLAAINKQGLRTPKDFRGKVTYANGETTGFDHTQGRR